MQIMLPATSFALAFEFLMLFLKRQCYMGIMHSGAAAPNASAKDPSGCFATRFAATAVFCVIMQLSTSYKHMLA